MNSTFLLEGQHALFSYYFEFKKLIVFNCAKYKINGGKCSNNIWQYHDVRFVVQVELTRSCIMLKNDQTHLKNLALRTVQAF